MMRRRAQRASVVLVALSCVTVLGIAMVGFLAVSNQAMKLSNRGYAKVVSKQLAEMGLERALRAFNAGSFPAGDWTVDATAATANLTLSIPSSRYGTSNISTTVKVRVDHYIAPQKATIWKEATAYVANDFVWYQGGWYLCTTTPATVATSNTSYWSSVAAWNSTTNYSVGAFAILGGTTVYSCLVANTNRNPSTNPTYWIVYNPSAWNSTNVYTVDDVVTSGGTVYRCILGQGPWNASKWKGAPALWTPYANYYVGNIALAGGTFYRCIADNINQSPPANAASWTAISAAAWSAATSYGVDDVALSGGEAYRCISAHTDKSPPNTSYWLSAPVIYAEGAATLSDSGATTFKTQLRATVAPAALFPNALGAATLVSLVSTGTVDSYNSPLGTYGQTTAPFSAGTPNIGSSAVLAGGNTAGNAVAITNMRVRGYVAAPSSSTSPYAPLWTYGTSGILTNTAAPTIPGTKIDLTRVSRSPYVPQFDITYPVPGANLPNDTTRLDDNGTTLGTVGKPSVYNITGTYDNGTSTLRSGLYLEDAADILTINGPVILNVSGTLYTNAGKIVINVGGSLQIYFNGQLWVGSGATSGVQNLTLDPSKCILVGTSSGNSSGSHYYWATYPFYGVIYMPNAYVNTWSNVVIYGAISASNIGFPQAGGVLHYDTALRTAGKIGASIDGPYEIAEWRELADLGDRIVLP